MYTCLRLSSRGSIRVTIDKVDGCVARRQEDLLAVEEPLEIRLGARSLSVTMRTPGHDAELAAGFLFAEGVVESARQIQEITTSGPNVVVVNLSSEAPIRRVAPSRGFITTSACGLCGKGSLRALEANRCPALPPRAFKLEPDILHRLPRRLREEQDVFDSTGGLHAAALFDARGNLESLREDVGRHNAVDKLIGRALLDSRTPLSDSILVVSGRASYELVQKALVAGIPVMAAVGAPSSLAVATAERCGMTLAGFLRDGRFNLYTGSL